MASTTSYIILLSPPLATPQHIQDIAGLPQAPEARPVDEEDSDDEEGEANDGAEDRITSCCVVDSPTKDAVSEWALSTGQRIKPIIPIIPTEPASIANALRTNYPVPYFLYGESASPHFLANLLDLGPRPTLQHATADRYHIKRWGKHHALIRGSEGSRAEGHVYMVRSEEEVAKLAEWAGFAYEVTKCLIRLHDDSTLEGNTFVYWWDPNELEDAG